MPKVSVVIATHSRPHLLPRAVESAQRAGSDVEVIVVDDASTDDTAEVCRNIQGIKYVRLERNRKVAGARNAGILVSTSEYIAFLDDDDVRLPGSLDSQIDTLERAPGAGLVYGRVMVGDDNCVPHNQPATPAKCPQGDVFWTLLERNFISCLSVVFRKSSLYSVGLLDENLHRIDDWDLWIRIAERYSVVAIEQPVAIWRAASPESGQGTSDLAGMFLLAATVHNRRWLALPRAAAASAQLRQRATRCFLAWASDMLIWTGSYELRRGHRNYVRRNLLTALRLNPLRSLRPWTVWLLVQTFLPRLLIRKDNRMPLEAIVSLSETR